MEAMPIATKPTLYFQCSSCTESQQHCPCGDIVQLLRSSAACRRTHAQSGATSEVVCSEDPADHGARRPLAADDFRCSPDLRQRGPLFLSLFIY